MTGELTEDEIRNILMSQTVCRIACTDGKMPYVVPVVYGYDGKNIYCQSKEGTKLKILRKNPEVCAQFDIINSMNNWKSVLVFGKFEELQHEGAETARKYLFSKVLTLMTPSTVHSFEHEKGGDIDDSNRIKSIMWRIKIDKITGRFEK